MAIGKGQRIPDTTAEQVDSDRVRWLESTFSALTEALEVWNRDKFLIASKEVRRADALNPLCDALDIIVEAAGARLVELKRLRVAMGLIEGAKRKGFEPYAEIILDRRGFHLQTSAPFGRYALIPVESDGGE